jgi:transposase InsO family protein
VNIFAFVICVQTIDITYIETDEGFLYLAGILDLYSRKMVGIAMADHMQTDLVEAALHMAWCERQAPRGVLHHSDRGSQFTSDRYLDLLEACGMTISMSCKGNCWDAAPIESFWGTLKAECATASFATRQQARAAIFSYIMGFYNRTRRHSALGYFSPEQFEQSVSR